MSDTTTEFYRRNARRYAEVAHAFTQSVYAASSRPTLTDDWVLLSRAVALSPGHSCLDAGCGAGARDVFALWRMGHEAYGLDAVPETILLAQEMHPEIADRVSVADLRKRLPFEDDRFDLVLCNAVIQHIPWNDVAEVTLPELVRVLRPGGVLQLMFKHGSGVLSLYDADYHEQRSFLLHDEQAVLKVLELCDMDLVGEDDASGLGGIMYFTDSKGAAHCAFHMRKRGHG